MMYAFIIISIKIPAGITDSKIYINEKNLE
jgi:hypothetical protein